MRIALRMAVSVALLLLVMRQVEWQGMLSAVSHTAWGWWGAAFLAFQGAMILAAKRWQWIVGASGARLAHLKAGAAVSATYVSLWLSNFLPTAFGGDVARVMTARRAGASLVAAVSGALLDRALGLATLALLFVVVEALMAAAGHTRPLLPVAAVLAATLAVSFAIAWRLVRVRVSRRWLRWRAVRFIARATGVLRTLGARQALYARVLIASLLATLLGVAAYWCAIRCVAPGVGFATALAVAALGTFASAIPISISGWGVREGAVALALSHSGALSPSDASLAAVLNAAVIAATSLVGLALWSGAAWNAGVGPSRSVAKLPRRTEGV